MPIERCLLAHPELFVEKFAVSDTSGSTVRVPEAYEIFDSESALKSHAVAVSLG